MKLKKSYQRVPGPLAGPSPRAPAWRLPWMAYPAHPRRRKARGTSLESEGAPAATAPHSCCFDTRGTINRRSAGGVSSSHRIQTDICLGVKWAQRRCVPRPGLLIGVNSHAHKLGANVLGRGQPLLIASRTIRPPKCSDDLVDLNPSSARTTGVLVLL